MTDPAIIASLITVIAVVVLALANLVYRFGRLAAQVEHLRRDESRRHDEMRREARERHEGLVSRLTRLETYFMTGSAGNGD